MHCGSSDGILSGLPPAPKIASLISDVLGYLTLHHPRFSKGKQMDTQTKYTEMVPTQSPLFSVLRSPFSMFHTRFSAQLTLFAKTESPPALSSSSRRL